MIEPAEHSEHAHQTKAQDSKILLSVSLKLLIKGQKIEQKTLGEAC